MRSIGKQDISLTEMKLLIMKMLIASMKLLIPAGHGKPDRREVQTDSVIDISQLQDDFHSFCFMGSFPGVRISGMVYIEKDSWMPQQTKIRVFWGKTSHEYLFSFLANGTDIKVAGYREI